LLDIFFVLSNFWLGLREMVVASSTVVELFTHHPKIEGTNPSTGTEREKITQKFFSFIY
jgi:hypothetical protein